MEYTSELQVTHHHEHCRLVDSVLGNADRGREEEGGPQELTGRNLAAGSSSFSGLLCVVISAYLKWIEKFHTTRAVNEPSRNITVPREGPY